jgi:mannose-6-phosphate isomerase-like protein (cupin superfamily)
MLQAGHPDSGEVLLIGKRVFGFALLASFALLVAAPLLAAHAQSAPAVAQSAPNAVTTQPEVLNFKALAEQGKALVEEARKGKGSQGIVLAKYNGSYTMLTARTKSGGAEMHQHFDDYLFVVAGEGTELTGGSIVDSKTGDNGEVRGVRLEGASAHMLHQGDVIHIPAGTPHQAIEAPGQTITIYVVKVEQPSIVR